MAPRHHFGPSSAIQCGFIFMFCILSAIHQASPQGYEVLEESKLFGEVPDAPIAFSATPYSTQISLRWDPPANGSTPISHYLLTYGEEIPTEINSEVTQYTLSNLKPGSDYVLSLRAANEFGSSEVLSTVATTKNTSDPSNVITQDVLQVIGHPLPNGVTFTEGLTGAAFKFEGDSNAGRHAEIILPTDFSANFPEFSILMLLRPYSGSRGTVFGVTDPYHQTIILSVNITSISIERMRISLILTNIDYTSESTEVAAFVVPSFTNHWTQLALSIRDNQVTLFLDCQELGTKFFDKHPGWHIRIPQMAPLFIGHLGTVGEQVQYRGDIQQIFITNSADSAEEHCPIGEISGSGSMALRESAGEDWAFVLSGSGEDPTDMPKMPITYFTQYDAETPSTPSNVRLPASVQPPLEQVNTILPKASPTTPSVHATPSSQPAVVVPPGEAMKGQKGEEGWPGVNGIHGNPGVPGPRGVGGETGPEGPEGPMGPKGEKGDLGDAGPVGPIGEEGFPGVAGPPGDPGVKGEEGDPGMDGYKGEKGEPGVGVPGLPGVAPTLSDEDMMRLRGEKGEPGMDGYPGIMGVQGPMGIPGVDGALGVPGPKGDKGEVGLGLPGSQGKPGKEGPKGETGQRGLPGPSSLESFIEGSGLEMFVGPPGLPGSPGRPGVMGPHGPRGDTGRDGIPGLDGIPGQPGPAGRDGGPGPKGEPGTLTEEEILDEIANLTAEFEMEGLPGMDGFNGSRGLPGVPGVVGPKGEHGMDGNPGMKGERGSSGIPGLEGAEGMKGNPGQNGIPGVPGIAGIPGESGQNGARGPPGPAGPPGPPGTSPLLPPGFPWTNMALNQDQEGSADGSGVWSGTVPPYLMGSPGPQGPPGPEGMQGEPGLVGEPGIPGEPATPGMPGPMGERGERGMTGLRGMQGEIGMDGTPGQKGDTGDPGVPGQPGSDGLPGPRGIGVQGPPGDRGLPGPRGIQGLKGDSGEQGPPCEIPPEILALSEHFAGVGSGDIGGGMITRAPQELTSTKGEKGDIGFDGVPGMDGHKGAKGYPGPRGPGGVGGPKGNNGSTGEKGEVGANGYQGPRGVKGDKGDMFLPTEEEMLMLKGDEGDTGRRGKKGLKGQFGIPGRPGRTGEPGPEGQTGPEGPEGPQGPPGPSGSGEGSCACDPTAFPPGEKGSMGHPGSPGPMGPDGVPGAPGLPGVQGLRGLEGYKGDRGDDGLEGRPGAQGLPGVPGIDGVRGEKGDPGDFFVNDEVFIGPPGEQGPPGRDGQPGESIKGEQGEPGYGSEGQPGRDGRDGSQGPPGPPGTPGPPGEPAYYNGNGNGNGERGLKGEPGEPGREGQSGSPGFDGRPGSRGPRGPQGPTGYGEPGPQGEPGQPGEPGGSIGHSGGGDYVGMARFATIQDMLDGMRGLEVGTMAFIIRVQELYIRVETGMQQVLLGATFTLPPTSEPRPQPRPQPSITSRTTTTTLTPTTTLAPFVDPTEPPQIPGPGLTDRPEPLLPGPEIPVADQPMLYMYALNTPQEGYMIGGISGADFKCWKQAKEAGLKGTYRAFLSSPLQDIKTIVRRQDKGLPIANAKQEVLFESWDDIFSTENEAPFHDSFHIYSFDGKDVMTDQTWPDKYMWHGSYPNGERMAESFCEAWRAQNHFARGQASPLSDHKLLGQDEFPCNNAFAVLCVQTARPNARK